MAQKLARHGSNNGYRAHLGAGQTPCIRCHNAHLLYQQQYSRTAKAQGIKYKGDQIIDHLYGATDNTPENLRARSVPSQAPVSARQPVSPAEPTTAPLSEPDGSEAQRAAEHRTGPTLAERLSAGLTNLVMPQGESPYVDSEQTPDYLHTVTPDPEPMGDEWSPVQDDEFVINAAGMAQITENLGTYLSVVGMTASLIDPYCGNVLADNLDNIVEKWTKVIAHYPKAAKLFMDSKSGVIFTWIAALQATWPLLMAIYKHHLARTVTVRDGIVYTRTQNGNAPVDATMPPMTDFNFTAS